MKTRRLWCRGVFVAVVLGTTCLAAAGPRTGLGDPYRLGVLGARGWAVKEGILIESTFEAGPAHGQLRVDDLLVSVNGARLNSDPYRVLASAIDRAEGENGEIVLVVRRDEESVQVTLHVRVIGSFGAKHETANPKAALLIREACEHLVHHQQGNGKWACYPRWTKSGLVPVTSVCGLAMLSTGDLGYLPTLRRARNYVSSRLKQSDLVAEADNKATWRFAYGGMFLAEYYLATGDRALPVELRMIVAALKELQEPSGGWPHSLRYTTSWQPHYRELIAPSYHALLALALIRKCGVEVPADVIDRGVDYLARCERGGHVKYRIGRGTGTADPGRAAGCAAALLLLGRQEKMATRMLGYVEKNLTATLGGHISALQHFSAVAIALRIASRRPGRGGRRYRALYRRFMDSFQWSIDLARANKGHFVPQPKERHWDRDNMMGHLWATGIHTLVLGLGEGRLGLSGAPVVPPADLPASTRGTKTLVGGPGWTTSGAFLSQHTRNGVRHISTYAGNKDADVGVAHFPLSGMGAEGLVFTAHGGVARVLLIAETKPPPTHIDDIRAFQNALLAGQYGKVVEQLQGPRSNELDLAVRWDLRRHGASPLRIYVIDALKSPWGFIALSEITLTKTQ